MVSLIRGFIVKSLGRSPHTTAIVNLQLIFMGVPGRACGNAFPVTTMPKSASFTKVRLEEKMIKITEPIAYFDAS